LDNQRLVKPRRQRVSSFSLMLQRIKKSLPL
jgi:hypothetical protein